MSSTVPGPEIPVPFSSGSIPSLKKRSSTSDDDSTMAAVVALPQGTAAKRYRPTPAKTFQCRGFGECRMVFSRSEHLARHIRKHTGERPFTCHCGKQFSRLDNLRQHAQTVHSDKQDQNERMMRDLTSLHASMAAANKATARGRGRQANAQVKAEDNAAAAAAVAAAVNGLRPGTSTGYEGWERDVDMDSPSSAGSPQSFRDQQQHSFQSFRPDQSFRSNNDHQSFRSNSSNILTTTTNSNAPVLQPAAMDFGPGPHSSNSPNHSPPSSSSTSPPLQSTGRAPPPAHLQLPNSHHSNRSSPYLQPPLSQDLLPGTLVRGPNSSLVLDQLSPHHQAVQEAAAAAAGGYFNFPSPPLPDYLPPASAGLVMGVPQTITDQERLLRRSISPTDLLPGAGAGTWVGEREIHRSRSTHPVPVRSASMMAMGTTAGLGRGHSQDDSRLWSSATMAQHPHQPHDPQRPAESSEAPRDSQLAYRTMMRRQQEEQMRKVQFHQQQQQGWGEYMPPQQQQHNLHHPHQHTLQHSHSAHNSPIHAQFPQHRHQSVPVDMRQQQADFNNGGYQHHGAQYPPQRLQYQHPGYEQGNTFDFGGNAFAGIPLTGPGMSVGGVKYEGGSPVL